MYRYIKQKLGKLYSQKLHRFIKIAAFILILWIAVCIALYTQDAVMPMLVKTARYKVNSLAVKAVNDAVDAAISDTLYDDIVKMRFNGEGKIASIETDAAKLNAIKSAVTKQIELEFAKTRAQKIKIPLGSFTGIGIFSGRGPMVTVKVMPLGIVSIDYGNLFTDAGINQTRHQIFININVDMQIFLTTAKDEYETVKTSICIAETVIIGDVPDFYTDK